MPICDLARDTVGFLTYSLLKLRMGQIQCCIRGRLSRDEAKTETWLSETETRPRHRHCETKTAKESYIFGCVFFSPVEFALTILGSLYSGLSL